MKKVIVVFGLILAGTSILYSQEKPVNTDSKKWSVGVDYVPFGNTPSQVEIVKWKNMEKGLRIYLRSLDMRYNAYSNCDTIIDLPYINVAWLKRHELKELERGYYYRGLGIGFDGSLYITATNNYNYHYQVTVSMDLTIPFGIEYFFVKSIPNLSYSVEIDPKIGINHEYYYSKTYSTPSSYRTLELNASISPRFFVHWYFN